MVGRTNTGGGGSGGTLTVTGIAGHTVTVTKDGKTYTRTFNSGGVAVFKGLSTGTWTVKMSGNGQTATRTVTITADYSIAIAYFSATITITYPANSTCVVTDSSGATIASNTNTGTDTKTWTATVNATGTYTVTATATDSSGKSKSRNVEITADGQSVSVELSYALVLFDGGDNTSVTGGWTYTITDTGFGTPDVRPDNLTVGTTLYWLPGRGWNGGGTDQKNRSGYARTKKKIDVTNYNTITAVSNYAEGHLTVGNASAALAVGTVSLDISALTGSYEVRLGDTVSGDKCSKVEISKLYLS